jgi:hypothetical protein
MKIQIQSDRYSIGYPSGPIAAIALLVLVIAVAVGLVAQLQKKIDIVSQPAEHSQNSDLRQLDDSPAVYDPDGEQWGAAVEEMQAVSDGTLQILPEEMPAYRRLMTWARQQSLDGLRHRAIQAQRPAFLHDPAKLRGRLFRVDLRVCRVLPYEVSDSRLGVRKLYEVWGWARQSGSWMYVGVVPELPPEFRTSETVSESATLFGYFLKVQGYVEAGAPPRSKPLQAPLLLGQLEWHRQPRPSALPNGAWWMLAIASPLLWFAWRATSALRHPGTPLGRHALDQDGARSLSADEWLRRIEPVADGHLTSLSRDGS